MGVAEPPEPKARPLTPRPPSIPPKPELLVKKEHNFHTLQGVANYKVVSKYKLLSTDTTTTP